MNHQGSSRKDLILKSLKRIDRTHGWIDVICLGKEQNESKISGLRKVLLPMMKMNISCFILQIRVSFNKSSLILILIISLTKNRDQLSLLVCRPLDLSSELSDCSNMKTLISTQICITLPCRAVTVYIWKRTISLKISDTIFIDKVLTQRGMDINLHYQKNTRLKSAKTHDYLKDFISQLVCFLCTSESCGTYTQ